MKTIHGGLAAMGLALMLLGCNSKEKENTALKLKLDSLSTELQASQAVALQLKEVDALIDSIDASRQVLRANTVEGTSYDNYSNRLREINRYVKNTEDKIAALEKTAKGSKGMSASIRKLKADLELRTQEIAALQMEVSKMRTENLSMSTAIAQKDSTLLAKEDVIKLREQDIATFETTLKDTNEKNQVALANMYYTQAQTLEVVADRTNFSPRKKKQAISEAIELYKVSLSLGKTEAQDRINELEKELS